MVPPWPHRQIATPAPPWVRLRSHQRWPVCTVKKLHDRPLRFAAGLPLPTPAPVAAPPGIQGFRGAHHGEGGHQARDQDQGGRPQGGAQPFVSRVLKHPHREGVKVHGPQRKGEGQILDGVHEHQQRTGQQGEGERLAVEGLRGGPPGCGDCIFFPNQVINPWSDVADID